MSESQYGNRQKSPGFGLSQEDIRKIIVEGDAALLTRAAERIGTDLVREITSAQIRNVFTTARQIEMSWPVRAEPNQEQKVKHAARQLLLLKPKLLYQASRDIRGGSGMKALSSVLIPAIDLVGNNREHFQNFVDFFEAILAYHTSAGGR